MIKEKRTIDEIMEKLESSKKPIAKSFHIGEGFRVLLFGFKKGMTIEDHDHDDIHRTKIFIISGNIVYREQDGTEYHLGQYDEYEIPANRIHNIKAAEDSIVMLTQE